MKSEKLSCKTAKQVDMVSYLQALGFRPKMIRGNNYWYLSPFRKENEASFKVCRVRSIWFDHGEGIGGTIIDFGVRYFQCSVVVFLEKISRIEHLTWLQPKNSPQINIPAAGKVVVTDSRPIADPVLRQYLHQRNIPLLIANRYCSEVEFELYGKRQLAIGFKNPSGGFELRNEAFKGSSSPKAITWIKNHPQNLSVFEGFFDFLSFQTLHYSDAIHHSFVVLNSLAFFEKCKKHFEQFQVVNLYLDRDPAGTRLTKKALTWSQKYRDKSQLYEGFKDLNDFHVASRVTV